MRLAVSSSLAWSFIDRTPSGWFTPTEHRPYRETTRTSIPQGAL